MKHTLPVLTIALAFSCSGKKTEIADQTARDSAVATTAVTPSAPVSSYNPSDSGTFKGFLDIFQSVDELPEWATTFLSDEPGKITTQDLVEADSVYLLLYVKFVPVGPGVDKLFAVTFAQDGTRLSEEVLGESYPSSGPDGGGSDFRYTYDPDRKVVYVVNSTTDWSEEDQQEFTYETWNPYYLDEDGSIVAGRKYPEISVRQLDESSFSDYSKEELKIMRNEIFAVYGYIFKTEPLKSYYAAMPWYVAERDNVDDMLTDIEKANVAMIKEVEGRK
jgi:hypothetical protein